MWLAIRNGWEHGWEGQGENESWAHAKRARRPSFWSRSPATVHASVCVSTPSLFSLLLFFFKVATKPAVKEEIVPDAIVKEGGVPSVRKCRADV